ncbi:hypothetical protein D3C80_1011150 [compost metagenome]
MRNEVLDLGEEEERIHLALHRRVGHIETFLGDAAKLPVTQGVTRLQCLAHPVLFRVHARLPPYLSSLKATGATSLYSWFSPVMPQTKA